MNEWMKDFDLLLGDTGSFASFFITLGRVRLVGCLFSFLPISNPRYCGPFVQTPDSEGNCFSYNIHSKFPNRTTNDWLPTLWHKRQKDKKDLKSYPGLSLLVIVVRLFIEAWKLFHVPFTLEQGHPRLCLGLSKTNPIFNGHGPPVLLDSKSVWQQEGLDPRQTLFYVPKARWLGISERVAAGPCYDDDICFLINWP